MTISRPWSALEQEAPELAKAGRELIYLFGPGQALLGTVRPDGGPRLHPICPVLDGSGLFGFIIPSPKLRDLVADGRYALHSLPPPQNDDAFYVTGIATRVENTDRRQRVARRYLMDLNQTEEPPGFEREVLFEFLIARCLWTRTTGHGDRDPTHTVWHAGSRET